MYVCVCLAVTEAEVRKAIEGGAQTRDAVTKKCRAGGDCGACHGMIDMMIEDHAEARASRPLADCPPALGSSEQLVPTTALTRKSAA
jgi:bacterioferritin-associated ferredoxin